jgi:flagellar motor switch protein FliM
MSEQVLSQEEIDALLSAMDKGDVALEGDSKSPGEAEPYDLTSESRMLKDQFYALEEVYDKFAGLLQNSLTTTLQKAIDVNFESTEMVKFGEFLQSFSNPTGLSIFNMEPLIGSALLAVEPGLVFSLIDCMFGGKGEAIKRMREFTLIEQRMVGKFSGEVLDSLERSWRSVYPVRMVLKKTETKPEFVHLVDPKDSVIVVVFSIKGETFSGNLYLCISYLMLEPIKDKLSTRSIRDVESENTWSAQLQDLLMEGSVDMSVELGKSINHTVRDLVNLRVGDIVKLNTGPHDPVRLMVESVPKYLGFPGVVKGSRAVQISELLPKGGGEGANGRG